MSHHCFFISFRGIGKTAEKIKYPSVCEDDVKTRRLFIFLSFNRWFIYKDTVKCGCKCIGMACATYISACRRPLDSLPLSWMPINFIWPFALKMDKLRILFAPCLEYICLNRYILVSHTCGIFRVENNTMQCALLVFTKNEKRKNQNSFFIDW